MRKRKCLKTLRSALTSVLIVSAVLADAQSRPSSIVVPRDMQKLGSVDPRFVSYNVEMVEVTGGRFWKPYKSKLKGDDEKPADFAQNPNQQVGDNSAMFEYRHPIDLRNPRLRKLASALGPSYVRVSGSWANSTFFQNDDGPPSKEAPKGFRAVLTRSEWAGVVEFSRAVDAKIVTSVAISPGTRNGSGVWDPDQARQLFSFTKSIGGSIAATEFMNEPTFPGPGGAPAGYDANAYAQDIRVFEPFLRKESPQTIFLGPGGVGEGISLMPAGGAAPSATKLSMIGTTDLMKVTPPVFDVFSYHFYGSVSSRCMGGVKKQDALVSDWLNRTDAVERYYAELRDKYLPGRPMWLTETAEAACGGDQLAGQFADTFRFLNQFGTLAQKGVKVVMHNTLASSDYGLLDEDTYEPRPDFWAALLWKRTMGPVVLDPHTILDESVRVYAHCMNGKKGGVTVLALNTDRSNTHDLRVNIAGNMYTLTASELSSAKVLLNGVELKVASDGSVPVLRGKHISSGTVQLPSASIAFMTFPNAQNESCRE